MNVLILTPDRVGSTLLQRLITVYMLGSNFDKPVINLHELTNGLISYYNEKLNRLVLGKPKDGGWGYFQTLEEITNLLKTHDHYKTSRLAHYHIAARNDKKSDQIDFYNYLNENFFVISCRRNNIFEHALSWVITSHTKKLNVYSVEQKLDLHLNLPKKIKVQREQIVKYLYAYKKYLQWVDTYFQVQSYFYYDKELFDIEKYILNLPFFDQKRSWNEMFNIPFTNYNLCNSVISNALYKNSGENFTKINYISSMEQYILLKGADWPKDIEDTVFDNITDSNIKNEIISLTSSREIFLTAKEANFLKVNYKNYLQTRDSLNSLVNDGFLVNPVPLKLHSLEEKMSLIENFEQCVEWYNEWNRLHKLGDTYNLNDLDICKNAEKENFFKPLNTTELLT